VPGAPADSVALALVPKAAVPDYDRLTLVVDRAGLGLRMLIARDGQGGTSTFVFKNLKENVGLPDARFGFTIPKGADVVTQ
jgi:outer membrane lipoprotein-sorting protein